MIISIHTPLAGSDRNPGPDLRREPISIHTPLAGSDNLYAAFLVTAIISIHTPLAGSDGSARGSSVRRPYFNPHSPCGERQTVGVKTVESNENFNPHSPCGERP